MKKSLFAFVLFGLSILFQNCIMSEKAYYKEKDITSLPQIEGEWKAIENKLNSNLPHILIIKQPSGGYTIISKESGDKPSKADTNKNVTLFAVADSYYFDYLKSNEGDSSKPLHFLQEIKINKDKLELLGISSKDMQKMIYEKKLTLPYTKKEDGTIIFTASTDQLQSFLFFNKKNKNLFEKIGRLQKIKSN